MKPVARMACTVATAKLVKTYYFILLILFVFCSCKTFSWPNDAGYDLTCDLSLNEILLKDSSLQQSRHSMFKRCLTRYAKACALFDDNFNFTSPSMLKVLQTIESIALQNKEAHDLLSDVYGKMAICYQDLGSDDEALTALRKSKSLRKNRIPDRSLFNIYLTLGSIFMKSYTYDSAEYYFTWIEDHLSEFTGLRKNEYHRLWNELGVLHYNYGDNALALDYYEQALQNGLSIYQPQAEQIIMLQNNIIAVLLKLDRPQQAIQKYRVLLSYNKTLPILYHNLGKAYQRIMKYDSALFFLKKAELLAASDDVLKVKLFNNLAVTYIELENYGRAQHYLELSILLNQKFYKTKNAALAYSYMNTAKICERKNDIRTSLKIYQTALVNLHFNFKDSSMYSNPSDLSNVVSRPFLFECLRHKALAFKKYYEVSKKEQDLLASFTTYALAIQMMDIISKSYSLEETKLLFNNKTHDVYEEAVSVAFELYQRTKEGRYKEAGFSFSEKAKMNVLSNAIHDLKFKKLPGIPTALINQQQKLKQDLSRALVRLSDARDSVQSVMLRNELHAKEIALARVQRLLDRNEKYRSFRFDQQPLQFSALKNHVQEDEALIEYFFAEHNAFIFVATKKDLTFSRVPLSPFFFQAFEKLTKCLYTNEDGVTYQGYDASYTIYQSLIEPILHHVKSKRRWIVVPDGMLNYIPVEALVSNKTHTRFVIEDYSIRYAYSGSLSFQSTDKNFEDDKRVFAFAPFDTVLNDMPSIYPLKASRKEIQDLPGKHFYNQAATKSAFLRGASSSTIIHLATHAETFSDEPLRSFIAFFPEPNHPTYDSKLYMPEIYNLDLDQTRLVVISACEAGGGKFMKGEGLISLSRAFAFAGCPSVITSLWKADDEASAKIMNSMYTNLEKGYTKDEALRGAKVEYLRTTSNHRFKSPVFWANFICIGNAEAIKKNRATAYALVIMASMGLLTVFLWTRKKSLKINVDRW